jgi:heterodisulfide reductase subunit B
MNMKPAIDVSYFPGCSLDSTATEKNLSLINLLSRLGINLVELDDWNCCGSSSAHSLDPELAFDLANRNLSLAPSGRPLIVACPSCLMRLREAQHHLENDENARIRYEERWGRPVDPKLQIQHYFELLDRKDLIFFTKDLAEKLNGVKCVIYYGCMLWRPPSLRTDKNYYGLMEKILTSLGATVLPWTSATQCCGTFLSVTRPDVITPIANKIISGAQDAGADFIITACAMCHLNLEIRPTVKPMIPTLHLTEILSLAMGTDDYAGWFSKHIVDPSPALRSKGLIQ